MNFNDTDREDMIMNLEKILKISKFLYSLHEDENELFKFVNELPSTNPTRIRDVIEAYKSSLPLQRNNTKGKIHSANILRLALAHKLVNGEAITNQLINGLKETFISDPNAFSRENLAAYKVEFDASQVTKNTFKHWDKPFKILFPFIISFDELAQTKKYFKNLVERLLQELNLKGAYVSTRYSFEGVTDKGDYKALFSLYPEQFKPKKRNATGHSESFQFHCMICNGVVRAGKYPGDSLSQILKSNFEEMETVKNEREISECFLRHKKCVVNSNNYLWEIKHFSDKSDFLDEQHILHEISGSTDVEGTKTKSSVSKIIKNLKMMEACKVRDAFRCRVCGFSYENTIVHAHHMIPFTEKNGRRISKKEELITLCPTCHAIAHHILRNNSDERFRHDQKILIEEIKKIKCLK